VKYEENDVGNFLKEVPHTPPRTLMEEKKRFALATSSISVWGRTVLFRRIATASCVGPFPLRSTILELF
jgi:hypothetical protein